MSAYDGLKKRLDSGDMLLFAGCYDALGARIAEQAGFDGIWLSGYALSASMLAFRRQGIAVPGSEVRETERRHVPGVRRPAAKVQEVGEVPAGPPWRSVSGPGRAGGKHKKQDRAGEPWVRVVHHGDTLIARRSWPDSYEHVRTATVPRYR